MILVPTMALRLYGVYVVCAAQEANENWDAPTALRGVEAAWATVTGGRAIAVQPVRVVAYGCGYVATPCGVMRCSCCL